MLVLYNILNSIREFIELGGDVLWAIVFVVLLMWTLILERIWYFYKVYPSDRKQVVSQWDHRADTTSWFAKGIRDQMISDASIKLKQNVGMIKALIAICPLLGLLGTVTGMVGVFDVMTYSGSSNARAMADGVSKATIPTMAGMVAALSGVYFGTFLERKAISESEQLEDLLQSH